MLHVPNEANRPRMSAVVPGSSARICCATRAGYYAPGHRDVGGVGSSGGRADREQDVKEPMMLEPGVGGRMRTARCSPAVHLNGTFRSATTASAARECRLIRERRRAQVAGPQRR